MGLKRRKPLKSSGKLRPVSKTRKRRAQINDDVEWSRRVISRDQRCMWPVGFRCGGGPLTAHHGIRRGIGKYRHELSNGITLCVAHHRQAEADPKEWKMSPDLEGDRWIAAGGWWQHGRLVTPGMWRSSQTS